MANDIAIGCARHWEDTIWLTYDSWWKDKNDDDYVHNVVQILDFTRVNCGRVVALLTILIVYIIMCQQSSKHFTTETANDVLGKDIYKEQMWETCDKRR